MAIQPSTPVNAVGHVDNEGILLVDPAIGGVPVTSGAPLPVSVISGTITGTFTSAANGPTGSPVPADADYIGYKDGSGNLAGVSASTPLPITGTVSIAASQTIAVTQATAASLNATVVPGASAIFEVSPTTAANTKTNPFFNAISDGTNGPAAVKAASTAAAATDLALVVTTNGSTTAGSPSNTAVTSTSSAVLAANTARRECAIVNTDVVVVYIGLGQVPTATAYHYALSPCTVAHDATGGTYTSDVWKGAINAIVASTSGHVSVTELT